MKADCEICRGSGVVRLPIYPRVRVGAFSAERVAKIEETSRSFACPECANSVPQERVAVIKCHSLVDSRIDDPGYIEAAKREAAFQLSAEILKAGFIEFERGPDDTRHLAFPVRATVGIVSRTDVATLEQRVSEHQERLAQEVIAEAAKQIRVWRSAYGGDELTIQKGQAVDSLNAALTRILAARSSMRAA